LISEASQQQEQTSNSIATNTEPEYQQQQQHTTDAFTLTDRSKDSREISRLVGKVKWFNAKVGYGFITRLDNNEDIFVHYSVITMKNPRHSIKTLADGEIVEFNIMATEITGPNGAPVRGNPYVSHIPVRRNDSFASGDGIRFAAAPRRYPQPTAALVYGPPTRIPRWVAGNFRGYNMQPW
jgi:CspA family cold shock protein